MLYDIIVSLIVASSSGGVFVCGNSANWPGTSTNAGKKPASCQLESGQCHKAGCFFFLQAIFSGLGVSNLPTGSAIQTNSVYASTAKKCYESPTICFS